MALVISGAVSLGSYEAGALVKLIRAARLSQKPDYKGPRIFIDTIAGASAGAMTGAMLAYCLLFGVREEILYQVWVKDIDLRKIENRFRPDSILSNACIKEIAEKYLKNPGGLSRGDINRENIQNCPVRLAISLTNLNGRQFNIPLRASGGKPDSFKAVTYKDWVYYDLIPGNWRDSTWDNIKQAARASGAFPAAFAPVKVRRKTGTCEKEIKEFLYTDGGVLNNKPLGLAVDAVFSPHSLGMPENAGTPVDLPARGRRYFVLVQPGADETKALKDNDGGSAAEVGFDSLFTIPRHQSIYEDLKKIEKINQHIFWNESFLSELKKKVLGADKNCFNGLEDVLRNKIREMLEYKKNIAPESRKEIYGFQKQRELLDESEPDLIRYFRLYVNLIGRLRGKEQIYFSIIRPVKESGMEKEILAGEFLEHFGGFLSEELRRNDFALGYRNANDWLINMGIPELTDDELVIYDKKGKPGQTIEYDCRLGQLKFKDLPYFTRLRAYFTGIKAIEVLFYGFAEKRRGFKRILYLATAFLRILAYALAAIGKGLWIAAAVIIFIVGLVNTVLFIQKYLPRLTGFF